VSQAVSGIRIIKMNNWEEEYGKQIADLRELESSRIRESNRLKALIEICFTVTTCIVPIMIFVVHILMGGILSPKIVFTTFTLSSVVQFSLVKYFPTCIVVSSCDGTIIYDV